jgi:hypothetical protein
LYYYHLKSAKASQIFRVAFGYQCESVCICGSAFLVAASLRQVLCVSVVERFFTTEAQRGGAANQIQKALLGFGVQTFSLTFSFLFPIGAVFTKEKRLKETKSQTESLDSEPAVERNKESD